MTRFILTTLCISVAVVACGGDDSDDKTTTDNGTSASDGAAGANGSDDPCETGCEATLEADCDNGPTTQAACVQTCQALGSGDCGEEYAAFQDCAEGEEVSCDDESGIPIVEPCATEQDDFIACLNG